MGAATSKSSWSNGDKVGQRFQWRKNNSYVDEERCLISDEELQ